MNAVEEELVKVSIAFEANGFTTAMAAHLFEYRRGDDFVSHAGDL